VEYRWDFNEDGETDATGVRVVHAFASQGLTEVTLTVLDAGGLSGSATETLQVLAPDQPPSTLGEIIQRMLSAVVLVEAVDLDKPGTGFIISPDGYILTAAHVVHGAREVASEIKVRVILKGEEQWFTATIPEPRMRHINLEIDAALLKIEASNLPTMRLGDSDTVQLLDEVIVIGFPAPLPADVPTTDRGDVNAKDRAIPVLYPWGEVIQRYLIQTDAVANRGNSGGPMLNKEGEVIGIVIAGVPLEASLKSIAFAVPINTVKSIIPPEILKGL
jgi:S1-C subfamily serine protease